jgi:arginase
MRNEPLHIFFPQWQGANDRRVYHAAHALRDRLAEGARLVPLPVSLAEVSTEAGVHQHASLVAQYRRAQALLAECLPSHVTVLGGDCNVSLAPVAYLHQRLPGTLVVLWLDQHADLNTPESSPSGNFHGMPVRHILGEGNADLRTAEAAALAPWQIVYLGAREFDPAESAFIDQRQMTVFGVETLKRQPYVVAEHLRRLGAQHVYLHIDSDILDISVYNGSGYPNAAGITPADVRLLMGALNGFAVVGGALTHYNSTDARDLATLAEVYGLMTAAVR